MNNCDMKEIGGYIEFENNHGNEYYENAIALNCGRSALRYILRSEKIKKLYIPYFLCDSVRSACEDEKVEVEYYSINDTFMPVLNKNISDDERVYIVNFYGQLTDEDINFFLEKFNYIIIDNAQDFYKKPMPGIDTIYSCRKFFGVADGSYLFTDTVSDEKYPTDISYDRMMFLLGRYEKTAGEFYPEYVNNNKLFRSEPIKYMSGLTHNLLRGIDYEFVKSRRTENFDFLHQHLKSMNMLNLIVPKGAFMYPLYIENGKELKKMLIENKIYVPTLWPDVFDVCDENMVEYSFAQNIVPLPCDQRYGIEHMMYIIELIKRK